MSATLEFPAPVAPALGDPVEVAPGVLWVRFALPFPLNHVNVYLLEDGPGWAVLDTGINDARSRGWWEALLAGPLAGRRPTRVIATHFHPDHVGLAGWLTHRCDVDLAMSRTEYLTTQLHRRWTDAEEIAAFRAFYAECGLDEAATAAMLERDIGYRWLTTDLPLSFQRLVAGDVLTIGGRRFEVMTGGGHSPELVMLLCRQDRLFLPADQVIAKISPNVSVWPQEPAGDPLGEFLKSLSELRATVPDDVFVLPAHNLPFRNLHARLDELMQHHSERCDVIREACPEPVAPAAIVPKLFPRPLDAYQTSFAFGETLAHVNHMLRRGQMVAEPGPDGRTLVRAA